MFKLKQKRTGAFWCAGRYWTIKAKSEPKFSKLDGLRMAVKDDKHWIRASEHFNPFCNAFFANCMRSCKMPYKYTTAPSQ